MPLTSILKILEIVFGDKNWCVRLVGKQIRGGIYLLATSKLIKTSRKVKIYPKHTPKYG